MNRKKKIAIAVGILVAAGIGGLANTGRMIGWGPFGFLHSWQGDVDKIKERYSAERKGEILFYGASNFAMWEQMDEDMAEYKIQNHAFGGSKDTDLVEYADQILFPYEPKIVFFQTGSNDYVELEGTDEEKVAKCMEYKRKMFAAFHEKMPDARFVIMSGLLLPGRSEYLEMTQMINEELKTYAQTEEYISFVDASRLTYDGSSIDESLFRKDGIHLNHEGELLWYENYIRPEIERLITTYGMEELRTEK